MIANIITSVIALLHFYFLYLEMFLWTKPKGLKAFNNTPERAQATAVLAANQGLYNGFIAAGLLWSVLPNDPLFSFQLKIFFLSCVAIAGLYGAKSVSIKIFYIQSLPALIALVVTALTSKV